MSHLPEVPGAERGPRVVVAVAGVGGAVALGLGLGFVGTTLVLLALAGAVATAVGPVLSRSTVRLDDIAVPRWPGPDAVTLAAGQRRLLGALGSAEQVRTSVQPRLTALVEDRLRARGIEPGTPAAREVQGEALTAFLLDPRPRAVSARGFAALLDRVEAL